MADRTANTTFYPSNDPTVIRGRISAEDGDTFILPYGHPTEVMISSQDDDDAIVSADIAATGLITLGCIGDDGNAIESENDFHMVFKAILKTQ